MKPQKFNIQEKLAKFSDHWSPKIAGEVNDDYIKIIKAKGELIWHSHEHEDELFLVIQGTLIMDFRDETIETGPGEILIVPKGVEHRPRTNGEEVSMIVIEPKETKHTGEVEHEKTVKVFDWV
jgi:mannose-6-phosphate isomerase-like protein (cupin superfamily)